MENIVTQDPRASLYARSYVRTIARRAMQLRQDFQRFSDTDIGRSRTVPFFPGKRVRVALRTYLCVMANINLPYMHDHSYLPAFVLTLWGCIPFQSTFTFG